MFLFYDTVSMRPLLVVDGVQQTRKIYLEETRRGCNEGALPKPFEGLRFSQDDVPPTVVWWRYLFPIGSVKRRNAMCGEET